MIDSTWELPTLDPQPFCDGHSACCCGVVLTDRVCIWHSRVSESIRNEVRFERNTPLAIKRD